VLDREIDWTLSETRKHLLSSGETRERELAEQNVVKTVYRIRKILSEQEKNLMVSSLQKHLGKKTRIKKF